MMRYFHLFFVVVYLLFAYWQLNDPDPILWIPVYFIAGYTSWQAYRQRFNEELLMILIMMSGAAATNTWLQMTAWEGVMTDGLAMKTTNQELAREALGLIICCGSFIIQLVQKKWFYH
jgi:hypothetical protein